jgi:hypothetical protein
MGGSATVQKALKSQPELTEGNVQSRETRLGVPLRDGVDDVGGIEEVVVQGEVTAAIEQDRASTRVSITGRFQRSYI